MAGYTRNDTGNNIANGNVIDAEDLDGEFNAIETAFGAVTGHNHDGTTGEGAPITQVGPAQDLVVSGTQVLPKTTNTLDLGSPSFKFKDAYVDGIAYVDAINLNGTAITSTAAELNALDGITATVTELNYTDGVTSSIQTQLDAKQPLDEELTALAGLTSAADRLPYFSGSGTAALTVFSSFGRTLIDDADAAAARTTLALGTIATQASSSVTITGGTITGITDLAVADGGTGVGTITGIIRGNGTSPFTAAVAGTDYLAPAAIGTTIQAYDADLAAVTGLASNGLITRTGAGTAAVRSVASGTGITVTNGDGVSGNPTVAVTGSLSSLAGLSLVQGDILYVTAANTLARLPKGTAGQALVMNTGATAPEWTEASGGWEYAWHPYDKVELADSNNGKIWSFSTDGAVATVTSPDFEDGYDYGFLFDRVGTNSGSTATLRVNFYRETSAAYSGVALITGTAIDSANGITGFLEVGGARLTRAAHYATLSGAQGIVFDGVSNNAVIVGAQVRHSTIQKILRVQLSPSVGSFAITGAAIYMMRRRNIF